MNKCDYCICKTCAIAQTNGGAEGCGNCEDCKVTNQKPVNMCTDYYNPEKKKEDKNES